MVLLIPGVVIDHPGFCQLGQMDVVQHGIEVLSIRDVAGSFGFGLDELVDEFIHGGGPVG